MTRKLKEITDPIINERSKYHSALLSRMLKYQYDLFYDAATILSSKHSAMTLVWTLCR